MSYAYIGYSDAIDEKESLEQKDVHEIPERVLMVFTNVQSVSKLPEEVLSSNIVQLRNGCHLRRMTRQHVINFIDTLDDEDHRQSILQKISKISADIPFMLVVEDRTKADIDSNGKEMDRRLEHNMVENCIQFVSNIPMCNKQFSVHEPEVELGYVWGAFTEANRPFFAKLWRSKQSGNKYVTIIFGACFQCQEYEKEDETIGILRKSGLDIIGCIEDKYGLLEVIRLLDRRRIFQYPPKQPIRYHSCYLCKDKEENVLVAYTTEVTEPYDDELTKTECNLLFTTHKNQSRSNELFHEKACSLRSQKDYQERHQIVKEAIYQWNIENVVYLNENDGAIAKIAVIINESNNAEEIAKAICYVYSIGYSYERKTIEDCMWPALLIREEFDYKYNGLIDSSGRQKIVNDDISKYVIREDWIYYETNTGDDWNVNYEDYKVRINGMEKQKHNDEIVWRTYSEEGWLYYSNNNDENKLYRIRADGTERQKVHDDSGGIFHVADGWVYYNKYNTDDNTDLGIHRVRIDGSDNHMICKPGGWKLYIVGEWIYYTYYQSDEKRHILCKIRVDGTEETELPDIKSSWNKIICEEWIYYANSGDNGKLYRVRTDGTDMHKLNDIDSRELTFADEWIYFQESVKVENGRMCMGIYRIRPDGSEQQVLTKAECQHYMIDEASDSIYFANGDDGSTMYRMCTDGTGLKKLNNDISSGMQVTDEWIYYLKGKPGYRKLYRIPIDGIVEGG